MVFEREVREFKSPHFLMFSPECQLYHLHHSFIPQENHSNSNPQMHTQILRKLNSRFALEHRYEDEDNLSFRRHPRSAVDVLTKKSSKDVIVDEGMPSKHRRYVEDLPKLGPQRTMTLYLCFCPEASASSHLMLQSKHFRVFLHGEQNVMLCSVAGTVLTLSLSHLKHTLTLTSTSTEQARQM